MPVFSRRAAGEAIDRKTGKREPVPPAEILKIVGPLMHIELRPTAAFLAALRAKDPVKASQVEKKGAIKGNGLIDTGASHTAIDAEIGSAFHLEPINVINVSTPSDAGYQATIYAGMELYIPDGNIVVETSVAGLQLKIKVFKRLLGATCYSMGYLFITGTMALTPLRFRPLRYRH